MADIAAYGSQALEIGKLVLFTILILGSVGIGIFFFIKEKKYRQFKCRIWQKDNFGNVVEKRDWAGIFVDKKTRNKRLFLKKNKVGLDPDKIPFIPKIGNGFSGRRVVYLFQTGLKNFHYIIPKPTYKIVTEKVKDKEGNVIIDESTGEPETITYDLLDTMKLQVGEEDTNWSINEYERQKKLTENLFLQQILPFIGLIVLFLGIVVLSYFLMQKFDVIVQAAELLNQAAEKIAAASSGTQIVQ